MTENGKGDDLYPCPCCGFLVFDEPPGSYRICSICGWEDCAVQLRFPFSGVGPNAALAEEQKATMEWLSTEVKERDGYRRDPQWRPVRTEDVTESDAAPQDGLAYFHAWGDEETGESPYYWRRLKSSPEAK